MFLVSTNQSISKLGRKLRMPCIRKVGSCFVNCGMYVSLPPVFAPRLMVKQSGRFAVSARLKGKQPLSSSATNAGAANRFTEKGYIPNGTAKEMSVEEIKETIADHVHAAKCAIEAGFDGVEIVCLVSTSCYRVCSDDT